MKNVLRRAKGSGGMGMVCSTDAWGRQEAKVIDLQSKGWGLSTPQRPRCFPAPKKGPVSLVMK